jgi:hypothetical protein
MLEGRAPEPRALALIAIDGTAEGVVEDGFDDDDALDVRELDLSFTAGCPGGGFGCSVADGRVATCGACVGWSSSMTSSISASCEPAHTGRTMPRAIAGMRSTECRACVTAYMCTCMRVYSCVYTPAGLCSRPHPAPCRPCGSCVTVAAKTPHLTAHQTNW